MSAAPTPGLAARLAARRAGVAGAVLLALIVLAVLVGPVLSPYGFDQADAGPADAGPSWGHPFGTAELGEDVLTRTLVAGRVSLLVGLGTAVAATIVGTALGLLAGGLGGWVDGILGRLTDLVLAVPAFVLLIVLSLSLEEVGVPEVTLILALLSWPTLFRLVRASALRTRERDHVRAARAAGARPGRIMLRHLLPAAAPEVAAFAGLAAALAILAETALSFLALGVNPELAPTWGNLVIGGRETIADRPWLTLFPGALVLLSVLAVSLMADAVRDALDPASARPIEAGRRWAP